MLRFLKSWEVFELLLLSPLPLPLSVRPSVLSATEASVFVFKLTAER